MYKSSKSPYFCSDAVFFPGFKSQTVADLNNNDYENCWDEANFSDNNSVSSWCSRNDWYQSYALCLHVLDKLESSDQIPNSRFAVD